MDEPAAHREQRGQRRMPRTVTPVEARLPPVVVVPEVVEPEPELV
ncbi:hypothetical protein [Streptomyces sp. NPDC050535]